jgi:hypothetical protein
MERQMDARTFKDLAPKPATDASVGASAALAEPKAYHRPDFAAAMRQVEAEFYDAA